MARKVNRATEADIALATLRIAATRIDGVATFARLKREIPNYVHLSADDRQQSVTRPNEEVWEQLIRNIKSHFNVAGNIICEGYAQHVPRVGYRITDNGKRYLKRRGA